MLEVALERRPPDVARHDRVDADAGGAQLLRHGLRRRDERGLGGGVAPEARLDDAHRHGADHDDRAAALYLHARDDGLRELERAEQVHVEDALPVLLARLLDQLVGRRAERVVDEHVDAPELGVRRVREAAAVLRARHVGRDGERPPPEGAHLGRDRLERRRRARREDDVRPLARQGERDRAPEPRADAGHDRDAIQEEGAHAPAAARMRVVEWRGSRSKGSTISDAERCEYSSRKWCSTDQTYLKPWRSEASASSTSRRRRACAAPPGSASTSWRGTCAWTKRPNSIPRRLAERARDCQTAAHGVTVASGTAWSCVRSRATSTPASRRSAASGPATRGS